MPLGAGDAQAAEVEPDEVVVGRLGPSYGPGTRASGSSTSSASSSPVSSTSASSTAGLDRVGVLGLATTEHDVLSLGAGRDEPYLPDDPKPPSPRSGAGERVDLVEHGVLDALHHELGDPVAAVQHGLARVEVDDGDGDRAAVGGVDGAGRVDDRQPVLEARPERGWTNRRTLGQGDRDAGREQAPLPGSDDGVDGRDQVEPASPGGRTTAAGRSGSSRHQDDGRRRRAGTRHGFTSRLSTLRRTARPSRARSTSPGRPWVVKCSSGTWMNSAAAVRATGPSGASSRPTAR